MRKLLIPLLLLPLLFPKVAWAHAFGQIYTLPLPVWLYLYGGAAAVAVSFLLVAYFAREGKQSYSYPTLEIPFLNTLTQDWFIFLVKLFSLVVFAAAVISGFLGTGVPTLNLIPNLFWILIMLGITYLSALIGNVWSVLNPLRIILSIVPGNKQPLTYPAKLGYLPAVIIYFFIIWLELLSNGIGVNPRFLSFFFLIYLSLSIMISYLFSKEIWFKYWDFLEVFFGLFSKIAPLEKKNNKIYLRPPFVALLKEKVTHPTLLIFILFMLSSTAFDGFKSTSTWLSFYYSFSYVLERLFHNNTYLLLHTIFWSLSPFIFLVVFLIGVGLMKLIVKSKESLLSLALKFAPSLIPIALAYNIAHYYTLLLTQGTTLINLISDPLNLGWNLFGTANLTTSIGFMNASFVWHSQVAVIIIGHIAAVYQSHREALRTFPSHRQAVVSQLPMLLIMVIYTMTGLWILSQPLTLRG